MNLRRVFWGVGANIYDKLIIAASQLLIVPILATTWGLKTYGAWLLLTTIPSFLSVGDLGFASAAGTQMTILRVRGEIAPTIRVFQSTLVFIMMASATVLAAALAIVYGLPDGILPDAIGFKASQARNTLYILVIYAVLSLQGSIFAAGFRCAGLFALGTFWSANTILFESLVVCTIVGLFNGGPVQAAIGLAVCRSIALAMQGMLLRIRVPWLAIGFGRADLQTFRALLSPALSTSAIPLAQASFLQGTVLALGMAATDAAVPAFSAVRTLSRVGLQLTQLLTHALMPEFTEAVASDRKRAQAAMLSLTSFCAIIIAAPFAVALAIFGPDIVVLWTHDVIHPDPSLTFAMALTIILGGFWNPLSNLILAMNRQAIFSYLFLVFALLTMPLTYVLARFLGATGAALSIAVMDGLMCVVVFNGFGRSQFAGIDELWSSLKDILSRALILLKAKAR